MRGGVGECQYVAHSCAIGQPLRKSPGTLPLESARAPRYVPPPGGAMATELAPDRILDLGTAFWGSKALLSAVELGLFSALAAGPLEGEALCARLGLHARSARDFF